MITGIFVALGALTVIDFVVSWRDRRRRRAVIAIYAAELEQIGLPLQRVDMDLWMKPIRAIFGDNAGTRGILVLDLNRSCDRDDARMEAARVRVESERVLAA